MMMRMPTVPGVFFHSAITSATAGSVHRYCDTWLAMAAPLFGRRGIYGSSLFGMGSNDLSLEA
jgi:hypothetical protein